MTKIIETHDFTNGQTLVPIEDLIVAQTAARSLARQVRELTTDRDETERERARLVELERSTAEQLRQVTVERDQLRDFVQFAMANAIFADGALRMALLGVAKSLGLSAEAADRVVEFFESRCRS